MQVTLLRLAPFLSLSLCLSACVSSVNSSGMHVPAVTSSSSHDHSSESDWLRPSPDLARRLRDQGARLPYLHAPQDKYDLVAWFATQGEVAYPILLQTVAEGSDEAASLALASLASTRDPRLLPALDKIPFPTPDRGLLRLERARCHMVLGDWNYASVLIEGLDAERPLVRAMCIKALRETTRMEFGFVPMGDPADRETALKAWQAWSAARSADIHRQG